MLDQHLASLEVVDFQSSSQENNPRLGAHSDIWTARMRDGESTQIQIVLSQPYTRWHELCVCYEVADWLLLNRVSIGREGGYPPLEVADNGIARAPAGNGTDGRFVLARLKRAGGQRGYVFYSAIDTTGRVIEPPPMIGGVGGRLDALFGSDPSGNDSGSTEVMMLQMFAIAPSKIGLQQINAIKRDFVKVRAKIASEFVAAQN